MNEVAGILSAIEHGDAMAADQLLPLVYDDLRQLAAYKLAQEKPGQTLQATALVHEAYLRIAHGQSAQQWESRRHFFAAAAEAMRRILIDQARQKQSGKRGGSLHRVTLDTGPSLVAPEGSPTDDLLALDEALRELEIEDPIKARLVKLRYFGELHSRMPPRCWASHPRLPSATGSTPARGSTAACMRNKRHFGCQFFLGGEPCLSHITHGRERNRRPKFTAMNRFAPGIETILAQAVEISSPDERQAFVEQACAGNLTLKRRVEQLIVNHFRAGSFLERPAVAMGSDWARGWETAGSASAPGTVIGPYKLLEQIGEGGMGIVYVAEQTRPMRRKVALKIIKPGMDTKQVVARFEAERQALAMMDHPSIARIHDGGATDTGRPYFVMELVRGIPITSYCDREQLSIAERLELFVLVCRAVQHAHQKGLIHRDLKPSNILVTVIDGVAVPKIIDFGVAKAIGASLSERTIYTGFHQFVGTPMYMSPEQADLSGVDVDTRSDVYSLGVLLYELLTGTTPFDSETLKHAAFDELRRIIREEDPPKPSTRLGRNERTTMSRFRPSSFIPHPSSFQELDWIVMKAIEKDRRKRYETANDFATDVMRHLSDQPVEACPPSAMYRLSKIARKHRTAFLTTGLFAVMLLAMSAVSTWQAVRATNAERRATGEATRAKRAEAQARAEAGNAERSAAESEAVRKFLENNLLAAARPEGLDGGLARDATILQAAESVRPQIAEAFAGQPVIEAAVRTTLGTTYLHLGEYSPAIEELERAVELRQDHLGPNHPDTIQSRVRLALANRDAGRAELAIVMLEDTLRLREATLGRDHPDTLGNRANLAIAYRLAGRTADAINMHEETIELKALKFGRLHPQTLASRNHLANAYLDAGRTALAITMLEDLVKVKSSIRPPDHLDRINDRNSLAFAYIRGGRAAEAIPLLEDVVNAREAKLGPVHPHTLKSRHNLADACEGAGRTARATRIREETLKLTESTLAPDHPAALLSRNGLAGAYLAAGRTAEAIRVLEAAPMLPSSKDGKVHRTRLIIMDNLAGAYLAERRSPEAERTARVRGTLENEVAGRLVAFSHSDPIRHRFGGAEEVRRSRVGLPRGLSGTEGGTRPKSQRRLRFCRFRPPDGS